MSKKHRRHDRTPATLARRVRSKARREQNREARIRRHLKKHGTDETARQALINPGKHRKHLDGNH